MTLHIFTRETELSSWVEQDMETLAIYDLGHRVGYSHPSEFRFKMVAAQHTLPLTLKSAILFYDDDVYTFASPNFEGFIDDITPGDATAEVEITCFDPTRKATSEIPIMNAPWQEAGGAGERPEPASDGVPRLVYNATIVQDDDYAHSRYGTSLQTVGYIIKELMTDSLPALRWVNAAPPGGRAYDPLQLDTLEYKPQEKVTFESESLRSGIDRLLTMYPAVRYVFLPGENNRQWNFVNINQAPAQTLTLNRFNYPGSPNVLTANLTRSMEGRKTAVRIYGPETTSVRTIQTAGLTEAQRDAGESFNSGSLTFGNGHLLQEYTDTTGTHEVWSYRWFQIADASKRRSALRLPRFYLSGMGSYNWIPTKNPVLEVSYDNGATWMTVPGIIFDNFNGIVYWQNYQYFWIENSPPNSDQEYWAPTNYRFIYPPYGSPISVRWPPSGYSGTAYDLAGLTAEDRIYDEMLAVGYEYGVPVTTASRVTQYLKVAKSLQEQSRDVAYTGGCVLEGIEYDFLRLNKRVNFAAVDQHGDTLVTGWENINAVLTDVEYRWGKEKTTTLTFSSDQMELLGWDIESLKDRLYVSALSSYNVWWLNLYTHNYGQTYFGNTIVGSQTLVLSQDTLYYNPLTGTTEGAL